MPQPENFYGTVRSLIAIVRAYNGRPHAYFNSSGPLWEQKWFSQFAKLALDLIHAGITPLEFSRMIPFPKGFFQPSYLLHPKVKKAIEDHIKFKQRLQNRGKNQVEKDKQFLKEMVETTGLPLLYLINFYWNDLHEETQRAFERFHNDYFLSTEL